MSEDEKMAQIGAAIQLFEEQKKNLAHLVAKLDSVRAAYAIFSGHAHRWAVDPTAKDRVVIAHPSNGPERDAPANLLSHPQLAELITEHKAAKDALEQTRAKLSSFGLTSFH